MDRNNLAWVMAMDELQGDIPDPSSFSPDDREEPEAPAPGGGRGDALTVAACDSPAPVER